MESSSKYLLLLCIAAIGIICGQASFNGLATKIGIHTLSKRSLEDETRFRRSGESSCSEKELQLALDQALDCVNKNEGKYYNFYFYFELLINIIIF